MRVCPSVESLEVTEPSGKTVLVVSSVGLIVVASLESDGAETDVASSFGGSAVFFVSAVAADESSKVLHASSEAPLKTELVSCVPEESLVAIGTSEVVALDTSGETVSVEAEVCSSDCCVAGSVEAVSSLLVLVAVAFMESELVHSYVVPAEFSLRKRLIVFTHKRNTARIVRTYVLG